MATCETADSVDETAAGVTGRLWEAVDLVIRGGIRADDGKSGVGSLGDKNEVEILYRRNKIRSANQNARRPVKSVRQ